MRYSVENYTQYQKDSESKAILNVDKNALEAYKTQRTAIKRAVLSNNELESLKAEIGEIKQMLSQLININSK